MSLDGVLVVDKPVGWTSHDAVARARKLLKVRRIGHTGTLDPIATGVLPLCIGKATRLVQYLIGADKSYRGVMRFGFSTSTYDRMGEPTSPVRPVTLSPEPLLPIFEKFRGEIRQVPPAYSAKKLAGRPLYQYARKGHPKTLSPVSVRVYRLELLGVEKDRAHFEITCSAGTYIRAIAHEIGQELDCGAHLEGLKRLRSGEFTLEQAVNLDEMGPEELLRHILPLRAILLKFPAVEVEGRTLRLFSHGGKVLVAQPSGPGPYCRVVDARGDLVGIGKWRGGGSQVLLCPDVVL
ncbi:MAG: tRNA pseudouridine(55) synthase TruB [Acidobacteria bacterium]|nr:tRNA pseudouridine(55) synthase TruB [Acidobacteriota bacterium]